MNLRDLVDFEKYSLKPVYYFDIKKLEKMFIEKYQHISPDRIVLPNDQNKSLVINCIEYKKALK